MTGAAEPDVILQVTDLDVEYARHHGFAFDLWIMLRTPLAVLRAHTA